MTVNYTPKGVCSRAMTVSANDGIITEACVMGGCNGNSQGLCKLVIGMKVEDAIDRLSGIECGGKSTSCPDQLSIALQKLLDEDTSN